MQAEERRANMEFEGSSRSAWESKRRAADISVGECRRVGFDSGMTRFSNTPEKGGSYGKLGSACTYMLYSFSWARVALKKSSQSGANGSGVVVRNKNASRLGSDGSGLTPAARRKSIWSSSSAVDGGLAGSDDDIVVAVILVVFYDSGFWVGTSLAGAAGDGDRSDSSGWRRDNGEDNGEGQTNEENAKE